MNSKKKTAAAVASRSGHKNIDIHSSAKKYTTLSSFEQDVLSKRKEVYLENDQGQNQCFHCERWFDWLPFCAIQFGEFLHASQVGLCKDCEKSLSILPPGLTEKFWQKVQKNLKKALGVKTDV